MNAFGQRLSQARKNLNITQARFAAALGLSQPSLCQIERGRNLPASCTLAKIAEHGVSLDWLFGFSDWPCIPPVRNFALDRIERNYKGAPVARRLKLLRKRLGMTQNDLCEAVGMKQGALSQLETDRTRPGGDTVVKFMKVLNVNPIWLMTGVGEMFLPGREGK